MQSFHEKYIVDKSGNKSEVVLPFSAWEEVQEMLEELEDIKAYDAAKRHKSDSLSFDDISEHLNKGH